MPTRRERKFALWPATLEGSSLRFPPFRRHPGHTPAFWYLPLGHKVAHLIQIALPSLQVNQKPP